MATTEQAVAGVRDAVCGIMRVERKVRPKRGKKPERIEIGLAFVGTAWCFNADQHLLTAHHVLNGGQARDPKHRFYVFTAPGNGKRAFHFPVVGFPLEDAGSDMAILEVGPPAVAGTHIAQVPVTFDRPADGSRVVTYGFPAPAIGGANVDPDGNFLGGGRFFLKGHANEGIVAAQYEMQGSWQYEFNVGWHHGESGGPVFQEAPQVAAFALMQAYRDIQGAHGTVAGPHMGRSLEVVQNELRRLGATVV
jgi:hypothetical protein